MKARFIRPIPLLFSALLAALCLGNAYAGGVETIRIGTEGDYPPFSELKSDDTLVGFDIDIAQALCDTMKVECEIVQQDWDGIIPALLAGKFDAIFSAVSVTPERKKKVAFTDKYMSIPAVLVVPKDSDIAAITDEALKGKTIGAQTTTTFARYAAAHLPDARLKLYQTPQDFEQDLINGRLDAIIDDKVVLSTWLKSNRGACCKLLGTYPIDPNIFGPGMAGALRKGDTVLLKRFNEALATIRQNGTYKRINDKYFDFDVYGD